MADKKETVKNAQLRSNKRGPLRRKEEWLSKKTTTSESAKEYDPGGEGRIKKKGQEGIFTRKKFSLQRKRRELIF